MTSGPSVSNLFPAIAQSFAVIIIGYLFGLFKIIDVKDSKSIGTLVGKLALPALLFKNLAILNLSAISWSFLGAMLVSKFTVFAVVAVLTAVLSRPFNVGKGGLFGIFVTQSNDFALGLPIVQALYPVVTSPDQFDYISYIYLLAPVSLAIINPIGFIFMEWQKNMEHKRMEMKQIPFIILRTLKGVIFNPVIFMTLLGLIVNVFVSYALHKTAPEDKLPDWLVGFLDLLGGAYAACALLNIGIFMVGKMKKITLNLVLVSSLLIAAKTILLPILAYRIVYTFVPGNPNANDSIVNFTSSLTSLRSSSSLPSVDPDDIPNTSYNISDATREDIATFGFLLGTFPTAPTVFVFASQYHLAMETVAASLVLCTFLSAPIMYVAARMVLVPYASYDQYDDIISDAQLDVSIISSISVVVVFALFLLARRHRSYIHVFIMHLMVAIFIEVVSINVMNAMSSRGYLYWEFFWFALFFIGVLSSRTWMACTSIGLLLLLRRGPTAAEKWWITLMLVAWGIPVIITILLVSICAATQLRLHKALVDISFLFGEAQLVISFVVLIITFAITAICTFFVILSARGLQKKNKQIMSAEGVEGDKDKKSSVAGENSSPSNVVKLKRAVPSPRNSDALWGGWQTPRGATPIGVNYGSNDVSEGGSSGSGSDGGGSGGGVFDAAQDVVTANTVYFTDSSTSKRSSNGGAGEGKLRRGGDGAGNTEDESIPLLAKDVASSAGGDDLESTADFQFGVLMEDSGLWYRDISGKHLIRFIVLLLLLLFSSLVGILIVLWKILTKEISGIFIAINVLDTITNFGQGVFLLILFGLEKHWFWMKLYSKLRGLLFKIETVIIPPKDELDPTILNQCSVFKAMHMDQCKEDILSDRRYIFWSYTSVFTGSGLVDWLMHQGIVSSREEAVEYGHTLMLGQVLAHVSEEHYFHDSGHFYQFL